MQFRGTEGIIFAKHIKPRHTWSTQGKEQLAAMMAQLQGTIPDTDYYSQRNWDHLHSKPEQLYVTEPVPVPVQMAVS
jgi:hypothetical protein